MVVSVRRLYRPPSPWRRLRRSAAALALAVAMLIPAEPAPAAEPPTPGETSASLNLSIRVARPTAIPNVKHDGKCYIVIKSNDCLTIVNFNIPLDYVVVATGTPGQTLALVRPE